jgi:Mrp family chromosome partitioning ATPase
MILMESSGANFKKPMNEHSSIKKVIAVMSGKGGVGKSSVTSLVSVCLSDMGFKVGILDADITGPSIMKIFGLEGQRAMATEKGAVPVETGGGIKVISIQALMEKGDTAAIWRGPILSGVVQQFWTDVMWGDLDYLVIDLPPGTADIPLTVMQSIPLDGVLVVTSPQELVELVVRKSVDMAKKMGTRIMGIVENMSYIVCGCCGNRIDLFGSSRADKIAEELGIEVIAKMPLDSGFVKASDEGAIERYRGELRELIGDAVKKLQ